MTSLTVLKLAELYIVSAQAIHSRIGYFSRPAISSITLTIYRTLSVLQNSGIMNKFKRRIKTQTVLPSAETAAMLFWALLASGQIVMRKVDGWPTLSEKPSSQIIDLAA
jgi:Fe2+ or Zn2+ uptake regulation protein